MTISSSQYRAVLTGLPQAKIDYRWRVGQDVSRKAHAVAHREWLQFTLCGAKGLGVLAESGEVPRCKKCVAMAKRLRVRVRKD